MRPSAKSRNSSRGSRLPERELTSIFFNGLLSAAWANFRGTDWKIRCFLPKMPNSSKTCGPRGRPGGSLSARNSTGLCENNERRSIAALVNLTGADVARPEFVLCRRTRAVIRAQQPAFGSTLTPILARSSACAGRPTGEVRSSRDSEASSRVELALTIATTLTTAFSASRPLQGIATIVSFLNPQPALSFVGGNLSSCPTAVIAQAHKPDLSGCGKADLRLDARRLRPGRHREATDGAGGGATVGARAVRSVIHVTPRRGAMW